MQVDSHKAGGAGRAGQADQAGRVNQKLRTRMAIVGACRELILAGGPVTMPAVARAALVSEPTAYRYFPDLISLLNEALVGMWPTPAEALEPVARSAGPVERVTFAAEFFLRRVLVYQGAVRAMIAATIARPELVAARPGIRFGLIDQALDPVAATAGLDQTLLTRLKQDLAAVISAEAVFSLTDLAGLAPGDAVASLVRTAGAITEAAMRQR